MPFLTVVIPAYGKTELTRAVVASCMLERDLVSTIVVDNMGDYQALADERVLRPGKNLGWLEGVNLGFRTALEEHETSAVIALNNDTTLSHNFFAGLATALKSLPRKSLVAPLYDDSFPAQRGLYLGPAHLFVPESIERRVPLIDGTCFLITTPALQAIGPLDARHFGRRGWGGIEDYCLAAQYRGVTVAVTHRAYLNHLPGQTARASGAAYERYASAELRRGMRRKWGSQWRSELEVTEASSDSIIVRVQDFLRFIEDRLGISRTRVGQTGVRGLLSSWFRK